MAALAAHRPHAVHAGGGGAAGVLLYALAQRLAANSEARAAVDCLCEAAADLDSAASSALVAELLERLPLAAIVFVAAAAGSFCGYRVGRGQLRRLPALYER